MKKGLNLKMVQNIICAVLIALALFFMLPCVMGILHIGMIYPAALFLLSAFIVKYPDKIRMLFDSKLKIPAIIASALLCIFVLGVLATLTAMGVTAANRTKNDKAVTVVVLGCLVNGTAPSRMLNDRINSAAEYLAANPNVKCIASGGKGDNEEISEAQCIKNELVKRGIDGERIIIEDKSTNTAENLEYSAKIIEQQGLLTDIAVASDNFHQLRAKIYADRNGLNASSLGCHTAFVLSGGYWAREVLGIAKAVIIG
ncbi:MAG: YdcF family protein [Acutalibacteraceae bacterium]